MDRRTRLPILLVVLAGLLAVLGAQTCAPEAPPPLMAVARRPVPENERSFSWPASRDEPPRSAPIEVHERDTARPFQVVPDTLENGLTVILVPDRAARRISAHVVVRAGAVDDPAEGGGTAHFVEHMMFKGTDRLGTADWDAEAPHLAALRTLYDELAVADADDRARIEDAIAAEHAAADLHGLPNEAMRLFGEIGVTLANASTGLEHTDYSASVPPNRLRAWAAVEAERFTAPAFRGFGNERRVVSEEVRLRSSHAEDAVSAAMRGALFRGHPYARPVGGTEDSVRGTTVSDLERFWDRFYVPRNAAVVLVGDFDRDEAWGIVEEAFGGLPDLPAPERFVPEPVPASASTRVRGSDRREVRIAWTVTDRTGPEWAALAVATEIVATETDARLGGATVAPRLERLARGGRVELVVGCYEPTRAECESAVLGAVADMQSRGPDALALRAARWRAEIARLRWVESPEAYATELVQAFARGAAPLDAWQEIVAMRTVTAEQVRRAAQDVFGSGWVATTGEGAEPLARPWRSLDRALPTDVDDPRTSAFYDAVVAMPVEPLPARWLVEGEHYTVSADGHVVASPNPYNHLFQLHLRWPVGWAADPMVCHALARWTWAGTSREGGRWAAELAADGVSVVASCDEFRATVGVDGPGMRAPEAIAEVLSALADPALGPERRFRARRRSTSDAAEALAKWGAGSPWLLRPPPEVERNALGSTLAPSLRALARTTPEVGYVGTLDADAVALLVGSGATVDPVVLAPHVPATTEMLGLDAPLAQVHVLRWSEPYDPAREGLYTLYDTWLARSSGLVWEVVREGTGSAYLVRTEYERSELVGGRNLLSVWIVGAEDQLPDVISDVLDAIGRRTVQGSRWERVVATADEQAWSDPIRFRRIPATVLEWRRRGIDGDAREVAWTTLGDVDRAAFEAFAAREAARPATLLVEGHLDPSVVARLEALAPLRSIEARDVLR